MKPIVFRMKQAGYCALLLLAFSACSKKQAPPPTLTDDPLVEEPAPGPRISALRSGPGDVVGKLIVGYQAWFSATGDGSPNNSWVHWSANGAPSPGNQTFELWPDTREYTTTFQTGYANLGNGQPARLFSSWTTQTMNTHFSWMQQYGIDCAALQRFGKSSAQKDGIATRVMTAAQTYGRKFYVMYDISGWTNFQAELKADWTNVIVNTLHLPSSSAYAYQNGKPVVCVWGAGVSGRPGNVTSWTDVINYLKGQGCYVIVGTPRDWRSQTTNLPAYNAADMVSPWSVGSFGDLGGADNYAAVMQADLAYLDGRGQDYLPVIWPGFAWSNWNGGAPNQIPRLHGDLMWRQFANVRNKAIPNMYVAMFDEYDEATAIAKAAENSSMKPTNQYFLSLDADGVAVSSDFYLRLTNDGARMVKGITSYVTAHPTPHTVSTGNVTFYQDVNYGGAASQSLPVGNYTMAQLAALGVPNDWASSVRVPAGRTVIMYANDNFTGTSWTRTGDTPNFTTLSPNANDQMSSCRVQ